ncbi:MAG: trypsin-like peptidase domain-containing protein, partial [Chloroflexota bacterium]|nr:trypsin-like peptidase domain-containing protein [Chloroflexota bacterium]
MSLLNELGERINAVGERVGPSVVRVGDRWRAGSGFVIEEGLVLTNAHNVRREQASVTFHGGREAVAAVRALDTDGDLAVLALDTAGAPAIEWSAAR